MQTTTAATWNPFMWSALAWPEIEKLIAELAIWQPDQLR
jgi:hypothetical protein